MCLQCLHASGAVVTGLASVIGGSGVLVVCMSSASRLDDASVDCVRGLVSGPICGSGIGCGGGPSIDASWSSIVR